MRIDLALKHLCLAKSRSAVKTMCDKEGVFLNGRPAKPSASVHIDDEIQIASPTQMLTICLLSIPERQLSKTVAPAYYRVVERERADE